MPRFLPVSQGCKETWRWNMEFLRPLYLLPQTHKIECLSRSRRLSRGIAHCAVQAETRPPMVSLWSAFDSTCKTTCYRTREGFLRTLSQVPCLFLEGTARLIVWLGLKLDLFTLQAAVPSWRPKRVYAKDSYGLSSCVQ